LQPTVRITIQREKRWEMTGVANVQDASRQ
jgi:hypothetical protein